VLAAAHTPNLDSLAAAGYFNDRAETGVRTVSGPGWSSMLTGVWPEKHGVLANRFEGHSLAAFPDFLTRLEAVDPRFRTLAVVNWPPLAAPVDGGPIIGQRVDARLLVNGDSIGYARADSIVVALAVEQLESGDPDAAFVYLGNADVVGHDSGSLSPAYRAAIEESDRHVGTLLAALGRRPAFAQEDWLILVSTDHGRRDDGGHGLPSRLERTIFYLASGPSAQAGRADGIAPQIVDVAVTALVHLGVTIRPEWQLDGRVVGLRR
jgi:arylsulfatase A-like enzyme